MIVANYFSQLENQNIFLKFKTSQILKNLLNTSKFIWIQIPFVYICPTLKLRIIFNFH